MNILNRWTGAIVKSIASDSLRGANLTDTDLRYANLRYTDLRYANLRYADLTGANLTDTDLRYADLTGANLTDTDLRYANLTGANLRGADLRGADLSLSNGLTASVDALRLAGSRHAIWCVDAGNVSVGCMHNSLDWWLEHYEAVGRRESYTQSQIAEYKRHLEYCREWLAARAAVKGQ